MSGNSVNVSKELVLAELLIPTGAKECRANYRPSLGKKQTPHPGGSGRAGIWGIFKMKRLSVTKCRECRDPYQMWRSGPLRYRGIKALAFLRC